MMSRSQSGRKLVQETSREVSAPSKKNSRTDRGGRPTKLTAETQNTICDALRRGCYYETAASLAGISVRTLRNWLRAGARALDDEADGRTQSAGERQLAGFHLACRQAEAEMEHEALGEISRHGEKEWTAHAWRLERRWPDRYGRRDRVSHDHELRIQVGLDPELDLRGYEPQAIPGEIVAESLPKQQRLGATFDASEKEVP